jgi:hypothetical protein
LVKQKRQFGGSTAQEYLDLVEAKEQTKNERLMQLAEKAVNQAAETECIHGSLFAAKARAVVDAGGAFLCADIPGFQLLQSKGKLLCGHNICFLYYCSRF